MECSLDAVRCLFHRLRPFDRKGSPGGLHLPQFVVCVVEMVVSPLHIHIADQGACSLLQGVAGRISGSEKGAVGIAPGLPAPMRVVNSGLGPNLLPA
ncbi:hypothetical protein DMH25_18640 [Streptomyces sp. WAC 01325]|nr:hypothetical protein DMH25_18640 [Streptomyces sp. WAC 01325]